MVSLLPLAACLLALLHASHQTTWEEGADAISHARQVAEKSAKDALKKVDASVLRFVDSELDKLEALGRKDMQAIGEFQGPGDKDLAIADSIKYWQGRMEDFIEPYVNHPESFKDVKFTDGDDYLPDPDNQSPEYLKTVTKLNSMVAEAYADLDKRYEEVIQGGPSDASQVTAWTARREGAKQALDAAKSDIRREAQLAKKFADRGENETAINRLRIQIQASKSNFESNIKDIFENNPVSP